MIKTTFIEIVVWLTILIGATFCLDAKAYTKDDNCIAVALFKEATRGSFNDHVGVYQVILNRASKARLSPCKVLKKPKQFSFVTERTNWVATEEQLETYEKVKQAPRLFNKHVLYFHRVNVYPSWRLKLKRVGRYGDHYYYQEKL